MKHIVTPRGTIIYRNDIGKLHREDGPAVIFKNGDCNYVVNGKLHRIDGPAVVRKDEKNEWYLFGVYSSEETYLQWIADNGMDINNLSEDDKFFITLTWTNEFWKS